MFRSSTSILIVLFICIFYSPSLKAQITDSILTPTITAIPLSLLREKIELADQQLKNLDLKTAFPKSVSDIDSLLPLYQITVDEQTEAHLNFKKSHPNKQKVLNLINKWGSNNAHLEKWAMIINDRLEDNVEYVATLENHNKEWELTYEHSKNGNVPHATLKLIEDILDKKDALMSKLNDQNQHFLNLETKVLILKEKITSNIHDLEVWKKTEEFSVFNQRHPPIWKLSFKKKASNNDFNAWASFQENVKGVYRFLIATENNILLYSVIFVLIVFLFLRFRRGFKALHINSKDEYLIKAGFVINSSPLASMLFMITIYSIIYFSNTPNLLSEAFLFLALISTIPFVRPTSHKKFKGIAHYILLLFLLNTIKSYVWYSAEAYRFYLMAEAVLAIFVIFRMTHPYLKTRRLDLKPLSALAVRLTPVLYLIFTASIALNIMGYTNFTDMLLKMGILGSVLGMVLFGMLTILTSFGTAAVHYRFSQLERFDPHNRMLIEKRLVQFVRTFSYIFILIYFLHVIDVYDNVVGFVNDLLDEPVKRGVLAFTWADVLLFVAILVGSYLVTALLSRIIDGGALDDLKLPKGIPAILSVSSRYLIIALAIVIALSTLGIDLGKFNLMAGALGLGIGFGLQNIISNFISGIILIFERPIQLNDMVELGPLIGKVKKIGVRSSNIRTFDGAEVVVPNSNLITNEVINWTLTDNVKRVEIKVGVAYGSDIKKVISILTDTATDHAHVLKDPPPSTLFDEFGNSSLDLRLLFWVPVEFGMISKSDISIEIYTRFEEEGITIPFPQRDLHLSEGDLKALLRKGEQEEDK